MSIRGIHYPFGRRNLTGHYGQYREGHPDPPKPGRCAHRFAPLGIEYEKTPTPKQRKEAHQIIDWGADLIIGHHTHMMQGIEIYKGKLIACSLGNFIFDQKGKGTDRSFMLSCRFRGKTLYSTEIIPLHRFQSYFPKIADGKMKRQIVDDLKKGSLPLNAEPDLLRKIGLQ